MSSQISPPQPVGPPGGAALDPGSSDRPMLNQRSRKDRGKDLSENGVHGGKEISSRSDSPPQRPHPSQSPTNQQGQNQHANPRTTSRSKQRRRKKQTPQVSRDPFPRETFRGVKAHELSRWTESSKYERSPIMRDKLGDRRVRIFWDLENVPLHPRHKCKDPLYSPHAQFDTIVQALGTVGGRNVRVRMYVYISQYRLVSDYTNATQDEIMDYHRNVNLTLCEGGRRNKLNIVDNAMKSEIQSFIRDADRGDVLVLISGDQDFHELVGSAKDTGLAVIVLGPPDAHAVAKRMHRVAHWYKPLHAFLEDNTEPKRGYHGTSGSETGGGSVEEYATPAVSRIPGVGDFAEVDATRHANRDGGGSRESGRRSGNESGSGGGEKGGADGGVAGNRIGIRGAGDVMGDGTGGTGRDGGVDMSRGPKEKEEDGGERQAHGRGGAEAGGVEKGKQETGLGEAMALAREDERGIRRGAGWLSCFGRKKVAAV